MTLTMLRCLARRRPGTRAAATLILGLAAGATTLAQADEAAPEALSAPFASAFVAGMANVGYAPTASVTRTVTTGLAQQLDKNLSVDFQMPDPRAYLTSGDALASADTLLTDRDLPTNDLASATTLLLIVAWEIVHDQRMTPRQVQAVLRQSARAFEDHPLVKARQADRQQAAQLRLMVAALLHAESRHRDDADQPALRDAVQRDMLSVSNNDMRALTASDTEGLVSATGAR